ncbi:hypothetical protein HYN51_15600 [Limnobaculum parvum]|uniref:Uncharacterized protein n=2 Tax=Limnobaculum parvum TaxID=2172103 RepID=A0A2Y9U170_9GAMM|nr:hypothetical protein HYN51_15600 [Limnobaculum parvum]
MGYLSAWVKNNNDITETINGLLLANQRVIVDKDYIVNQIQLVSGAHISGISKAESKLLLVPPKVLVGSGETANLYHRADSGDLSDILIEHLTIDGGRCPNPPQQYHHIIGVWLGGSELVKNISIRECDFKNAGEDFIKFSVSSNRAKVSNVFVENCRFVTEDDKIDLPGYSMSSSGNAVRTILTTSSTSNYGTEAIYNVNITDCFAKRIRTLADFKRGTSSSLVKNCYTEDMFDCHHSTDGAFDICFSDLTCFTSLDFTKGTATNFIEAQGERLTISNISGFGNNVTKLGIFITDYGLPAENSVGHQSVNCTISDVKLEGLLSDGIKVQNGINCNVSNIDIKTCLGHSVLFTSGIARIDSNGLRLKGQGNSYDNISGCGWAFPPKSQGINFARGLAINEHGQDDIYIPGTVLRVAENDYGDWSSKYEPENLITNRYMEFIPNTTSNVIGMMNGRFYEEVITAPSTPSGVISAITLNDASSVSLREIYHPPFMAWPNDLFYCRIWVMKGTAPYFAIVMQELDANKTTINSTFYSYSTGSLTAWTELVMKHKITNANAAFVMVGLIPASGSNSPQNKGTTHVADWRCGRSPFGKY